MRRTVPTERLQSIEPFDRGLNAAEVAARRQRYGPNDIVEKVSRPLLDLVRDTASDPMIWFLAVTAVVYLFLGERVEATVLLVATVPILALDAVLHRRTRASTEGLRSRLAARATVVRDGGPVEVPAIEIVPGDLALVQSGEPFPADGLLLAGDGLMADESSLTGESHPARKRPVAVSPAGGAEASVDTVHWAFAGTRLLTGRARLRVVHTGGETLYGEIVRSAAVGARTRTPLQQAVARLTLALVVAAAALCLLLAAVRYAQGYGPVDAFLSAITLAVAALPEEFPVVFTFFLGVGVYRLARRQALVRRAVSVENIGRVSCICSDKTGTITEGRLRVEEVRPAGAVARDDLLRWAARASRRESGDPLDAAIADAAGDEAPEGTERVAVFPFTESRRCETGIVRLADGGLQAAVKGAPETVLAMTDLEGADRREAVAAVADSARRGRRVIACAWKPLDPDWDGSEPRTGFRFAGLLAYADPVRPEVPAAVRLCREAGIHLIMVTGDHPATARAIALEIGLADGEPRVLSGEDLEAFLRTASPRDLRHLDVIARAVPAQKLALVRALQRSGDIVAVTGDGVNDVPALQAADIGIAMGERGTRSAREAAAIVLLDDNFRTITRAVAEGRQLFENLRSSFHYLLLIHMPLVLTAALVPLAGYPLLYLPIHIVWLEAIIHPTALLVFQELSTTDRLERRGGRKRLRFFSGREMGWIAGGGFLLTVLILFGYVKSLSGPGGVAHGRAMALAILTFSSAALATVLSGLRTAGSRLIVAATLLSTLVFVETPPLARLLHLTPLHTWDLVAALLGALVAAGAPLLARISQFKVSPPDEAGGSSEEEDLHAPA